MRDKSHPLSLQNILAFIGANITLGSLLGWAANFIQIITFTNGLIIFSIIFVFSSMVMGIRTYNYHVSRLRNLESQLEDEKKKSEELQKRLDRLVIEFRLRSAVNPRPSVVSAFINTKKLLKSNFHITATDITPKLIIIDKGEEHGLTYGMFFALYIKGSNDSVETCQIDHVEPKTAWISHSGKLIQKHANPDNLTIQPILPSDLQEAEREIGEILLIAEGFKEI